MGEPEPAEEHGPQAMSPEDAQGVTGGGKAPARGRLEKPSRAHIEAHERDGHVLFQPWCAHCRAARATRQAHKVKPHEGEAEEVGEEPPEGRPPMLVMDYMYMAR